MMRHILLITICLLPLSCYPRTPSSGLSETVEQNDSKAAALHSLSQLYLRTLTGQTIPGSTKESETTGLELNPIPIRNDSIEFLNFNLYRIAANVTQISTEIRLNQLELEGRYERWEKIFGSKNKILDIGFKAKPTLLISLDLSFTSQTLSSGAIELHPAPIYNLDLSAKKAEKSGRVGSRIVEIKILEIPVKNDYKNIVQNQLKITLNQYLNDPAFKSKLEEKIQENLEKMDQQNKLTISKFPITYMVKLIL